MRHFFSPWSWSLASLFSSTAFALTLFGAVNADAAIIVPANPNVQPASSLPVGTEQLVEMNQDFVVYPDLDTENAGSPHLATPFARRVPDFGHQHVDQRCLARSYRSGQRSDGGYE